MIIKNKKNLTNYKKGENGHSIFGFCSCQIRDLKRRLSIAELKLKTMSFQFQFRPVLGFSLVELTIDLVIISIIIAAFAPVITKKIKNNALGITNFTTSCSKFGSYCNFCNSKKCLMCEITDCPGKTLNIEQCKCE